MHFSVIDHLDIRLGSQKVTENIPTELLSIFVPTTATDSDTNVIHSGPHNHQQEFVIVATREGNTISQGNYRSHVRIIPHEAVQDLLTNPLNLFVAAMAVDTVISSLSKLYKKSKRKFLPKVHISEEFSSIEDMVWLASELNNLPVQPVGSVAE